MRRSFSYAVAVLVIAFLVLTSTVCRDRRRDEMVPYATVLESCPRLRVVLAQSKGAFRIRIPGPFEIHAAGEPSPIVTGDALPETAVRLDGGSIAVGLRKIARREVIIEPLGASGFEIVGENPRTYDGRLRVLAGSRGLIPINEVDLEEYVAGVVSAEMPARFHPQALAAQAVAARTYACYQMKTASPEKPWHLASDTSSQMYLGRPSAYSPARRAVEMTRGIILTWSWRVFPAYYHSTCGGRTISAADVFGGREIPPLAGATCGYCDASDYYRKEVVVDAADVARAIEKMGYDIGEVLEITPETVAFPVRPRNLVVKHSRGISTIHAQTFRMTLGPGKLPSTAFRARREGSVFRFSCAGWGHGVGMCQWGADGMGRHGYSAAEILARYYPGAMLVRIYE